MQESKINDPVRRAGTANIKVLMYHRVLEQAPSGNPKYHYIEADQFRKQMELLDAWNFTPITFYDYQLYLNGELSLPAKPVIITFDDGYLDTLEVAVPILNDLSIPAVIYVLGNRNLNAGEWDRVDGMEPPPLMNDEQIKEIQALGFEIGSHTMNHLPLNELDDQTIQRELGDAKKVIEDLLGEPVISVSYPFGSVDERVTSAAEACGYNFGCGVFTGPATFGEHLFDIRRMAIHQSLNHLQFLMRLLTPYEYAEWIYTRYKKTPESSTISDYPNHDSDKTEPISGIQ